MFQLENKYYLYAFGLIPVFIIVYWIVSRWRKKALAAYGDIAIIQRLFPDVSRSKRIWKFILFLFVFAFLIMGIVNPQVGTKLEEVKRKGADLMICLDVSNSMKAEDLQPNRLEKAKQAISKLLDKLEGDRIGIIVFGGEAYVQLPITTDYSAAKLFLESINTDMIPTQGTAIGAAIDLSIESFGKDEGKNKAIVIITDGENHEELYEELNRYMNNFINSKCNEAQLNYDCYASIKEFLENNDIEYNYDFFSEYLSVDPYDVDSDTNDDE